MTLIEQVAEHTGVPSEVILGPSRCQVVVDARWLFIRRMCELGLPAVTIARVVRRDPSTVAHALKMMGMCR